MPWDIKCCNCKEKIPIYNKNMFFIVQPTILEDGDWKRVKYGGFEQLMLCRNCLFTDRRKVKLKRERRRRKSIGKQE